MRKCNNVFNAQRGGFPKDKGGKVVRAAHRVAQVVSDKGVQLMQNFQLTGALHRVSGWWEPMTKKAEQFSVAYGGSPKRWQEGVFA